VRAPELVHGDLEAIRARREEEAIERHEQRQALLRRLLELGGDLTLARHGMTLEERVAWLEGRL
jgi:hypothetical protein